MAVYSEDGNWEFVDGNWIPTDKQKQSGSPVSGPPQIDSNPLTFANEQVTSTANEVKMNLTADEQYASLSGLTTSRTHTAGVVNQFGNPFYQDQQSMVTFQSIDNPGAEKLKSNLLTMHNNIQQTARNNFQSGERTFTAEEIIEKMLNEGEDIVDAQFLKIKEVKSRIPDAKMDLTINEIPDSKHIGVRAIITNKRLMLVDSTEDAISNLEYLNAYQKPEFMQRKKSGAYAVKHRIMHDFWIKSISHEDVNATEFHFSDFSESRQELKRFHHPISIIIGMLGFITLFLGFVDPLFIFFSFAIFIVTFLVWYYISQTNLYTMMSPHGKKREITIGYFDKIYNQNLVLDITLEDSQNIQDTTDWLRVLHDYTEK